MRKTVNICPVFASCQVEILPQHSFMSIHQSSYSLNCELCSMMEQAVNKLSQSSKKHILKVCLAKFQVDQPQIVEMASHIKRNKLGLIFYILKHDTFKLCLVKVSCRSTANCRNGVTFRRNVIKTLCKTRCEKIVLRKRF